MEARLGTPAAKMTCSKNRETSAMQCNAFQSLPWPVDDLFFVCQGLLFQDSSNTLNQQLSLFPICRESFVKEDQENNKVMRKVVLEIIIACQKARKLYTLS